MTTPARDKEKDGSKSYMLEINLISAQELKVGTDRRVQTYAVAWIDDSCKLRTRVDRVGGENPTWNDKFVFRVDPEFLCHDTSAVNVAIYCLGFFRDKLLGTVRFLISTLYPSGTAPSAEVAASYLRTPSATALQINLGSGGFHGVLNIGAMVIDGNEFGMLGGMLAMGYRDLMGQNRRGNHHRSRLLRKSMSSIVRDNAGNPMDDDSSGDSTPTKSPSALKEISNSPELAQRHGRSRSHGGIFLCGLGGGYLRKLK